MRRRLFSALLTVCAVSAAGGLAPLSVANAAPRADAVKIVVIAELKARCGFGSRPQDPSGIADLTVPGSITIPFSLECNAPFVIGVKSGSGGFKSSRTPDASGFRFVQPYTATLNVDTDRQRRDIDQRCSSTVLTEASTARCDMRASAAGQGVRSGNAVSVGGDASLTVQWSPDASAPRLIAGAYQETITIYLAART